MNPLDQIKLHPGYKGMFTTDDYAGAMPHGTRVRKRNSEPGDAHPDGITFYFVEWDILPKVAVGCNMMKVEKADGV
jgi:hypothetical protein